MKSTNPKNPFVVGRYISDEYFCDRKEENLFLNKQMRNGRNVALISPRRLGKSGLIHHFFNQPDIQADFNTFFVDIYATNSLQEFVYLLGKEIYSQLKPQSTIWKEKFFQIVSSLRAGFKLDATTGLPGFDIGIGEIQTPHTTLDEIFAYIEESDKPCIIAIDEFQQIGEYAEENVEALLRTKIQQCRQAQFIFAGSKRHLMSNMFLSPAKPFYQSAISMGLEPIPKDVYTDFAVQQFESHNKNLQREVAETIWNNFNGYTWFVQMLMNELFALTDEGTTCTTDMIETAKQNVIITQENSYKDLLARLPQKQKIILQAIAKEGLARNITSAKFIKKYNLNSASSVQAAVKILLKNDILTHDNDTFRIYDYFLAEWIVSNY